MRTTLHTTRSFRQTATAAGLAAALTLLAGCAQDAADHVDAGDVRQAAADDVPGDERGPAVPPASAPGGTIEGTGQLGQDRDVRAGAIMLATDGASGPYLANSAGSALYYLEGDIDGSGCVEACTEAWPPALVGEVAPSAGAQVDASLLGTVSRADGSTQVTYNGNPLYRYAGDIGAGRTNGMDVRDKYGQWRLVGPQGKPVRGDANGSNTSDDGATPAPAGG